MAVGPGEAVLALAGELAPRLAPAAPVGSADVGGDVAHPLRSAVGGDSHGAAVDDWGGTDGQKRVGQSILC